MSESSREPAMIGAACAYCGRARPLALLEPCCERPEHADRLVCADAHSCLGVVLGLLHESESRQEQPVDYPKPEPGRRLCAHADDDGPMHWLEPGEVCPRATTSALPVASTSVTSDATSDTRDDATSVATAVDAELAARITAGSALLADYLRWTTGATIIGATPESGGAGDWAHWADRLAHHLGYVISAVSR